MNRFFNVLSMVATFIILWFIGLALMGLVAKMIYRSLMVGWNLV